MAIFGRSHHPLVHIGAPQLGDVVDHDEVGVEVDEALDLVGEDVGEVDSCVVERLVQSLADGLGD